MSNITYHGITLSVENWARILGCTTSTLRRHLKVVDQGMRSFDRQIREYKRGNEMQRY